MSGWVFKVTDLNGDTKTELFDEDEEGTMDDTLTGLFLNLDGIDSISIARQLPGWENNG